MLPLQSPDACVNNRPLTQEGIAYVHLRQLTGQDAPHPRASLHPHLPLLPALLALAFRRPCLFFTPSQERCERVAVANMVTCPVWRAGAEHFKLEGQDCSKESAPSRGREGVERMEEVGAFGGGLVEETKAGERGQAQGPQLFMCCYQLGSNLSRI